MVVAGFGIAAWALLGGGGAHDLSLN